MEENKNKKIDAFLKKQIQDIPLDTPSSDFMSNVMNQIQLVEVSTATKYKPLISRKVWIFLAAAVAAIFFIPFQKKEGGLLEKVSLDFSFLDKIDVSSFFDGLSVSNTVFYGLLFFCIMILVQVFYLKDYFSKRIASGL